MHGDDAGGLIGHRVVSGTGEELGVVSDVVRSPEGHITKLAFIEDEGAPPRFVPLRFVREIGDGRVRLAGPREGYHITRVGTQKVVARVMSTKPWDDA